MLTRWPTEKTLQNIGLKESDTERWPSPKRDPVDEDHPEAHGYYLTGEPGEGPRTLNIYYRHWESDAPITERVSMPMGDSTDAEIAFTDFMREKSLALIDFELRDEEYLQLVSEIRELELEEHSSLTFKFGDVTGCWVSVSVEHCRWSFLHFSRRSSHH